jgi:hypothetical protein
MTRSTHSRRRRRRRLLRALTVALAALALTMPASALAGWPASEKTAGVEPPTKAKAPITSEKLAGLPNIVPISDETGAPRDAMYVPSADDKVIVHTPITWLYPDAPEAIPHWGPGTNQLDVAVQPAQVARDDRGIDWSDAGIASALTLAAILVAAAAALTIRRRRGSLAH